MLYNKNQVVRRLQESEKEFLTEKELLWLATPFIKSIHQDMSLIERAIEKDYTNRYSINSVSEITSISRPTLYRWEKEGIIRRKNNKINMLDLHGFITLIDSRISRNVTLL
jgi:hypothetical protein